MQISKIIAVLFMITIALSPIYWFFLMSPMLMSMIKLILLSMLLFFAFAYAILSKNMQKYFIENRNINYFFVVIMVFMLIGIFEKNNQSLYTLQFNEYNMFVYSFFFLYIKFSDIWDQFQIGFNLLHMCANHTKPVPIESAHQGLSVGTCFVLFA